jgi:uncharacterized protein YkwD
MSRSSGWVLPAALAALVTIVATTLASYPAAALELPGDPAVAHLAVVEQALLDVTNADRASNGLPALEFDPDTLTIARVRAQAQLRTGSLTHYDPRGALAFVQLLDGAGVPYGLAGENLARATTSGDDTVPRIQAALMKSPTHRKNILEQRFRRAAIGAATENGRITFAEIFRGE